MTDQTKIRPFQSDLPCGRRRFLALGRYYAEAIRSIQSRGLPAALEAVDLMGGAGQRMGIARGLVDAASKLGTVPEKRIVTYPRRRIDDGAEVLDIIVEIPTLTWKFRGRSRRQVGMIDWTPMFAFTNRLNAPPKVRPLP